MSDTLKPCPHCGGHPQMRVDYGDERCNYSNDYTVVCNKCRVRLMATDDVPVRGGYATPGTGETKAIAAWNTRALDEASYRAGVEDAARIAEAAHMVVNAPTAKRQRYASNLVNVIVGAIRALPTPSTLPQEGGRP